LLHHAAYHGDTIFVQKLLENKFIDIMSNHNLYKQTPLHFALETLFYYTTKDTTQILQVLSCIKLLVQAGSDVNSTDTYKESFTCLEFARAIKRKHGFNPLSINK
jgi:ankyrin repeat protein